MNSQVHRLFPLRVTFSIFLVCLCINNYSEGGGVTTENPKDIINRQLCLANDETVRAKRKKCLLRPDTGPCRADILAYYFDGRQQRCYRFFYGGCQGNGNNFHTRRECLDECMLFPRMETYHKPYFCSLEFDFGTCFGQYNRYYWDSVTQICKRRIYSGCGGNQNNFETKAECMATCLVKPNNTLNAPHQDFTTCIPFTLPDFD